MKYLIRSFFVLLVVLLLLFLAFLYQTRDRFSGYDLDIRYQSETDKEVYTAFSKRSITPVGFDSWVDANDDAQFDKSDGDSFIDLNNNGKFDPIWIAGFQNKRPAQGVLDDLWARTMMISDGDFKFAYCVIDAIGFGMDDIIRARKKIEKESKIDYVIIASTHSHQTPDLLGLWGPSNFKSGINREYREYVIDQISESVIEASKNLSPSKLIVTKDAQGAADMVMDTREPYILDPTLRLIQSIDNETDTTLGAFIAWANHPETLWDHNLQLSSDFPHFARVGVENGIFEGDSLIINGLGGVAIYANGSIGGLMTTVPEYPIVDKISGIKYEGATFEKTKAQGRSLAYLALQALNDGTTNDTISHAKLKLNARSIRLKMENKLFTLGVALGVLDRGFSGWKRMRSEVAYWELGPISFLHHPAEIYPEIVLGGIEEPQGADFDIEIGESSPLQELLPGDYKFIMGLSNDMIGYVIPKSQWDVKAPYTYDNKYAPYGEINSLGPDTGPDLYRALVNIIGE